MRTTVVSGGADGIGAGLTEHFLKQGERVIVIGCSPGKGAQLKARAATFGAEDRLIFLQADLSTIQENQRVIHDIKNITNRVDTLILCANKFNQQRQITHDGLEYTFALYFLSRYLLAFGLQDLLKKSSSPLILSVSGAGMKGSINWDDLQSTKKYGGFQATLQASHLNDLLGLAFVEQVDKVNFILFNPIFVKTDGLVNGYKNTLLRGFIGLVASVFAKSVDQTVATIVRLINNPAPDRLSMYKQQKKIHTQLKPNDATRLLSEVRRILAQTANPPQAMPGH